MQKQANYLSGYLFFLGMLSYFLTSGVSLTAFIPSVFGLLIFGINFILKYVGSSKILLHSMIVIVLIGLLGSFSGIIHLISLFSSTLNEGENFSAPISKSLMAIGCIIYLFWGVKSFVQARKNK